MALNADTQSADAETDSSGGAHVCSEAGTGSKANMGGSARGRFCLILLLAVLGGQQLQLIDLLPLL